MILLYAIAKKECVAAHLRGERRLRDCFPAGSNSNGGFPEFTADPSIPQDTDSAVVEIAFENEQSLRRYMVENLDAHPFYALPPDVLDRGTAQQVSEDEVLNFAREQLQYFIPPSTTPLWQFIRNTSEAERMARWGPYWMRAYTEFENEKPASYTDSQPASISRSSRLGRRDPPIRTRVGTSQRDAPNAEHLIPNPEQPT
jgi:hypothetical protein